MSNPANSARCQLHEKARVVGIHHYVAAHAAMQSSTGSTFPSGDARFVWKGGAADAAQLIRPYEVDIRMAWRR